MCNLKKNKLTKVAAFELANEYYRNKPDKKTFCKKKQQQ